MTQVFVSIGSNINRKNNLSIALKELKANFGNIKCSNIYQNPAVGFEGDDFYNLVAEINVQIGVHQLNKILKSIEKKAGRNHQDPKFSARTLDIDILLFANENYQPDLDIPRNEISKYLFILQPLAEISPKTIHPILKKPIEQLFLELMPNKKLTTKIDLNK